MASRPWAFSRRWEHRLSKGTFDATLSLLLLPLILPLKVVITVFVLAEPLGPTMFIHKWTGKEGCPVYRHKFRTTRWNPDASTHRSFIRAFAARESGGGSSGQIVCKPFDDSEGTRRAGSCSGPTWMDCRRCSMC